MSSTYVKVYDDLEDHPNWQDIDQLAEAVGLWTLAFIYCGRNRTDGHFPKRLVSRRWAGTEAVRDELLQAGRWHAPGHDCADCPQPAEGQFYMHAYLERNRSREQIEALSEKRSEAGKRGGAARHGKQLAEQVSGPVKQTPSRSKPDTDTATKNTQAAAAAAEFDRFWTLYPRKVGKEAARKAYDKARRNTDEAAVAAGLLNATQVWRTTQTEPRFIPHPATWLNEGRWADEVALPGMPEQTRRPTLMQCSQQDTHPRHETEDAHNRYVCMGVDA